MPTLRWKWTFSATPMAVWTYISDMQRVEQASGMPSVAFKDTPHPEGGSTLHGRTRQLGLLLVWNERPFEWVAGEYFRVQRNYTKGPLELADNRVTLETTPEGTLLNHSLELKGKNWFWNLVARFFVGIRMRRAFLRVYKQIDAYLKQDEPLAFSKRAMHRSKVNPAKLRFLSRRLADAQTADMAQLMSIHLREEADRDLHHMRPFAVADTWDVSREKTLSLFLHATNVGMLTLHWDILCPLCRNSPEHFDNLRDIKTQVHCTACGIDFGPDLATNVQATFSPVPSVRELEVEDFCTAGPQTTPHILIQQLVGPQASTTVRIRLEEGHYRLRGPRFSGTTRIQIESAEASNLHFRPSENHEELSKVGGDLTLHLENPGSDEQVILLERDAHRADAATADLVIADLEFRHYFAEQALAPGQKLSISRMYFLFTDLQNSVRLYEELGDAEAYAMVRTHFKTLAGIIEEFGGSVIKTVGDSIMAVFSEPTAAIYAVEEAHRQTKLDSSDRLTIKFGMHGGPCLVIDANGAMDYFGRTVNMASRFQDLSQGGDFVISMDIANNPEITALLVELQADCTDEEAMLKGFNDPVPFQRVRFADKPV
ncbi:MAG: hypothetical protein CMH54_01245 [Myxococcales bacterium]|nr:hypothetical protein [Myxococcales bacterium]